MTNVQVFVEMLAAAVADELGRWEARLASETMVIFDLGCYPWHGYLELSFLTANEPQLSERLAEDNIAEWRLYNFAPQWPAGKPLAQRMKEHWSKDPNKAGVSELYFSICAEAMLSGRVSSALASYKLHPTFHVRVLNPDDRHSGNCCELVNDREV